MDTGRGGLTSPLSASNLISSAGAISSIGALDAAVSSAERLVSSSMAQPLVSPLSNKMMLPQAAKANDGINSADNGNVGEAAAMAGRVFSPSVVPGIQWRPGHSFQNQSEAGQFRGRTEITPDQREKFLQRFQQVQQQGQSTILGMPPLAGGNHKHFSSQQQNPLLQQFSSQSSAVSPQVGLGVGVQTSGLNAATSASLQQQSNSTHQQSTRQLMMSTGHKGAEGVKIDELHYQQTLFDESAAESAMNTGIVRNLVSEDDLKVLYGLDTPPAGVSGLLTESAQIPRNISLSSGQPLQSNQPSGSLGVIGRRSISDLGAIGDNLGGSTVNSGGMYDQLYNLQMLESAYYKLPQPKDSERAKSYTPKHPAATPSSYPQVQAPIVNNPAFWERLGADNYGTDTLFFAFYCQQNTYQQYLAAKELKRQSWRYHKKYNTWFQRYEEPKVATDDYEQGTYVYFDVHISDELQHGWSQRIKTEFRFEYNYLEDELIV